MTAHDNTSQGATALRMKRGASYRATTRTGQACGEYLGMEAPHGDLTIMLRNDRGVHSIALDAVTHVERIAA